MAKKFRHRGKVVRSVNQYPSFDAGRAAVWHEAFKARKPIGHLKKRDGSMVTIRTPLTREWRRKQGKWIIEDLIQMYKTPERARMRYWEHIEPIYVEKGWRKYELDWLKEWIDKELYKRSRKSKVREDFKISELKRGEKVDL